MKPTLEVLGSFEVRSYDVMVLLGVTVGVVLFLREARRVGFSGSVMVVFCTGAVVSGILGARLNAWLFQHWGVIAGSELQFASIRSGLTSFGGILGPLIFAAIFARWKAWGVWALLDVGAPIIPLGEAIQRWGCFLNGCCYGRRTDGPFGVYLPDSRGFWADRFPTQLITSLFCVSLFVWLCRRRSHRSFEGELILLFLVAYHVGRFAIDSLRGDQQVVAGGLTTFQFVCLVIAGVGAVAVTHLGVHRTSRGKPT